MTYNGKVVVGGPADVRELANLTISKLAVGPYNNNCYLLRCRATGAQLLIDAAAEPDKLLDLVGPEPLGTVVTTHSHPDHWAALGAVKSATSARLIAHQDDAEAIPVAQDEVVADGALIRFGEINLTAVHLVGHTPGSIALRYDDPDGPPHVFTGDCLFPGGIGRTTTPEDFASLLQGVRSKLFDVLPDETWIYPGHGNDTTLGAERSHLAEWRERGW